MTVGPKIIDASVKKRMKAALKDIQSGKFAKDWVAEYKSGYKKYNALLAAGEKHPIEKTGAKLRSMMPWMQKRQIKGAQAAYRPRGLRWTYRRPSTSEVRRFLFPDFPPPRHPVPQWPAA